MCGGDWGLGVGSLSEDHSSQGSEFRKLRGVRSPGKGEVKLEHGEPCSSSGNAKPSAPAPVGARDGGEFGLQGHESPTPSSGGGP